MGRRGAVLSAQERRNLLAQADEEFAKSAPYVSDHLAADVSATPWALSDLTHAVRALTLTVRALIEPVEDVVASGTFTLFEGDAVDTLDDERDPRE